MAIQAPEKAIFYFLSYDRYIVRGNIKGMDYFISIAFSSFHSLFRPPCLISTFSLNFFKDRGRVGRPAADKLR
jgi:hypothetical protein